jgi:hypothetical protein
MTFSFPRSHRCLLGLVHSCTGLGPEAFPTSDVTKFISYTERTLWVCGVESREGHKRILKDNFTAGQSF